MMKTYTKKFSSTTLNIGLAASMVIAMISGCSTNPAKPNKPTQKPTHAGVSRSNPASWLGQYSGTAPCIPANARSCKKRKINLSLSFDNNYRLITTVIRPRGEPYRLVSNGRFVWDASGKVITLASKDGNARLQLAPRKLIRLPSLHDGKEDANSSYVLHKNR